MEQVDCVGECGRVCVAVCVAITDGRFFPVALSMEQVHTPIMCDSFMLQYVAVCCSMSPIELFPVALSMEQMHMPIICDSFMRDMTHMYVTHSCVT